MELDDQLAERITAIFVEKIKNVQYEPRQSWIDIDVEPRNIEGRRYVGSFNIFLLTLYSSIKGFQYPFFLTPKQAIDLKLDFKGANCISVFFFNHGIAPRYDNIPKIDYDTYLHLERKEKEKYRVYDVTGYKYVMNIDQTDFALKYPEKLEELINSPAIEHNYSFKPLDDLIEENGWICPIHESFQNRALYSPLNEFIEIPSREQFPDINSFYSTLLHEMVHSTGSVSRLKRPAFVDPDHRNYRQNRAKEELIAELGAVIASLKFGITKEIQKENFAYVQDWLQVLNNDPQFIGQVMKDVIKAVHIIDQKVEEISQSQDIKIGNPDKPEQKKILANINQVLAFSKQTSTPKTLKLKP